MKRFNFLPLSIRYAFSMAVVRSAESTSCSLSANFVRLAWITPSHSVDWARLAGWTQCSFSVGVERLSESTTT